MGGDRSWVHLVAKMVILVWDLESSVLSPRTLYILINESINLLPMHMEV